MLKKSETSERQNVLQELQWKKQAKDEDHLKEGRTSSKRM